MAICRLLKEGSLEPDDIARIVKAYKGALELLRPKDQTEPVKELVAKKIIEIARSGVWGIFLLILLGVIYIQQAHPQITHPTGQPTR